MVRGMPSSGDSGWPAVQRAALASAVCRAPSASTATIVFERRIEARDAREAGLEHRHGIEPARRKIGR